MNTVQLTGNLTTQVQVTCNILTSACKVIREYFMLPTSMHTQDVLLYVSGFKQVNSIVGCECAHECKSLAFTLRASSTCKSLMSDSHSLVKLPVIRCERVIHVSHSWVTRTRLSSYLWAVLQYSSQVTWQMRVSESQHTRESRVCVMLHMCANFSTHEC